MQKNNLPSQIRRAIPFVVCLCFPPVVLRGGEGQLEEEHREPARFSVAGKVPNQSEVGVGPGVRFPTEERRRFGGHPSSGSMC